MGHRFNREDPIGFALFALIEAFDLRIVPDGKICRLHKRPRQILVAILDIPLALAFPVTQFLTPHTPTIGSKISDRRKTPNCSRLQHDRHAENLSNPTDGE